MSKWRGHGFHFFSIGDVVEEVGTNEISFVGAGRAIHGDHSDKKSSMGFSHVSGSSWGNDEQSVNDHRSCGMPIPLADLTETPPPTPVLCKPS
jgi:hypothetical protein